MSAIETDAIKLPPRGLSPYEVQRLRIRLRRSACSETWVDDQIITTTQIDTDGDLITARPF